MSVCVCVWVYVLLWVDAVRCVTFNCNNMMCVCGGVLFIWIDCALFETKEIHQLICLFICIYFLHLNLPETHVSDWWIEVDNRNGCALLLVPFETWWLTGWKSFEYFFRFQIRLSIARIRKFSWCMQSGNGKREMNY